MQTVVRYYRSLNVTVQLTIRSAFTALTVFLSTLLGQQLQILLKLEGAWQLVFVFFAAISVVAILVVVSMMVRAWLEAIAAQEEVTKRALAFAHSQTDRWVAQCAERLTELERQGLTNVEVYVPDDPIYGITFLIESLYQTLDAHFSQAERIGERIDFEVTFMTKSYVDGKITIAAWANRERRMPRSLTMRKQDPDIYSKTVTAEVYNDTRPHMRVIEDTSDHTSGYADLYAGQRERIRSSVIYPVLSDQNLLLGTLVAHCDAPKFFKQQDQKYWRELLEVFAKRLALEKTRADYAVRCVANCNSVEKQPFHPF